MSTRSRIAMVYEDGTVKSIYCHFDGYPSGVGKTLNKYYTDPEKVKALMELGDISALGITTEHKPEDWKNWYTENERCVIYRDDGEENTDALEFASLKDYIAWLKGGNLDQEFFYLFDSGKWWLQDDETFEPAVTVTFAISHKM